MGGGCHLQTIIFYFIVNEKNTRKKRRTQGKDKENTGNFVLIRAWQP